ncbi:MAG: SUF system Fe-S cluster assembly regulator [Salinisphaeraceae bacterium]|jgi:FeS assembly SUF system regulator|nr:SUF system Fe-S cluster assembly regulator [Salinisphaeraceae bacterium]
MLRLSKLTDYGMIVITDLARAPDTLRNAAELAGRTRISQPTVSKLLKRLTRAGLVTSERGAHGGYRLALAPGDIDMAQVIAALEGPMGLTECTVDEGRCSLEPVCGLRDNWQIINTAIRQALEDISLEQMTSPLPALKLRMQQSTRKTL